MIVNSGPSQPSCARSPTRCSSAPTPSSSAACPIGPTDRYAIDIGSREFAEVGGLMSYGANIGFVAGDRGSIIASSRARSRASFPSGPGQVRDGLSILRPPRQEFSGLARCCRKLQTATDFLCKKSDRRSPIDVAQSRYRGCQRVYFQAMRPFLARVRASFNQRDRTKRSRAEAAPNHSSTMDECRDRPTPPVCCPWTIQCWQRTGSTDDAWERHCLFRCGAIIAARSHRPSINVRKRPPNI